MVAQSITIGILFGTVWGKMFSNRYKSLTSTMPSSGREGTAPHRGSRPSRGASSRLLASTSIIRYLLLAAVLITLMARQYIVVSWWVVGFMISFWIILVRSVRLSPPGDTRAVAVGFNPQVRRRSLAPKQGEVIRENSNI